MNVDVKPSPAGGALLTEPPEIARVGVIGAGQMGNGIAHVCALAGLPVILLDVKAGGADKRAWRPWRATWTARSTAR